MFLFKHLTVNQLLPCKRFIPDVLTINYITESHVPLQHSLSIR